MFLLHISHHKQENEIGFLLDFVLFSFLFYLVFGFGFGFFFLSLSLSLSN